MLHPLAIGRLRRGAAGGDHREKNGHGEAGEGSHAPA